MKRNTMSFKAIINNMAKENNVTAQSVLQTYMLERLLERISISKYKDNFILKGGMLISAMLGIDSRTTMDMDTTIKGFPLTKDNITNIMDEMCNIEIDDNVTLKINKVELIREDDDYGGYRITFEAIVKRGVLSTRIRDYYDVYMLINTQSKIIDKKTLKDAITLTAQYRGTSEIIKDWKKIVEKIANDSKMQRQWKRYQKDNFYAEEIEYNDLINAISKVGKIFDS